MSRYIFVTIIALASIWPAATALATTAPDSDTESAPLPSVLTLKDAQRIALRDNPSLKAAEARVKQAHARVRQALATFFPRLEFSGGYTKIWLSENNGTFGFGGGFGSFGTSGLSGSSGLSTIPGAKLSSEDVSSLLSQITQLLQENRQAEAADLDELDLYRAGFTASLPLFTGFERKFSYAAAQSGLQESDAAYQEAQRILLEAVADTFYIGQLARENAGIARADEAFNLRQLEEAKARRRVGTGSLSDELNFEVRVNAAGTELIRAERDHAVALVGLTELMGIEDTAPLDSFELAPLDPETPEEMELPNADNQIDYAYKHRPDLQQSEHAVKRSGATVGARRAPFFPTVSATASYDGLRFDDARFRQEDFSTSAGVAVTYTLFAGGQNRAALVEAKVARTEAERNLAGLEIQIASEVRQALEDLKAAQAGLVLQRANTAFVQQNRDLVEKEYRAGQASLTRLNEAQRDLIQAQALLALAQVSLRQAWHSLHTTTAETLALHAD